MAFLQPVPLAPLHLECDEFLAAEMLKNLQADCRALYDWIANSEIVTVANKQNAVLQLDCGILLSLQAIDVNY